MINTHGIHIMCELSDCHREKLADLVFIETTMQAAAKVANATMVASVFHPFEPQGVSGVVVVQESHLSIHTWPELGYAALDFYTCGEHTDPAAAMQYVADQLNTESICMSRIRRGSKEDDFYVHHLPGTRI